VYRAADQAVGLLPMEPDPQRPRSADLATACAIGVVAYAGADVVHELIGHAGTAWLLGIPIVRISSVALQTHGSSRLLASAGPGTNVVVGCLALVAAGRARRLTAGTWFLWLFAAVNLTQVLDLTTSAASDSGDSAVVIRGLHPAWAWRSGMALVGFAAYVAVVRGSARVLSGLVREQSLPAAEISRLIRAAYLSGAAVLIIASIFNPIGPRSILTSGVGASLLFTAGFLRIPALVRTTTTEHEPESSIPRSGTVLAIGTLAAIAFIAWFGPGFSL
jgi:hypothetical protein